MTSNLIRRGLREVLTTAGLTDAPGKPLEFAPHDFRRSGLPPHVAQVIAGHASINTTMGYHAIYPAEAIEAHRAFITRRRAQCPGEEYRTPTDAEWDDFLSHFERRPLSVGTCAAPSAHHASTSTPAYPNFAAREPRWSSSRAVNVVR
ncbi:hypothetical protein ACGFZK_21665 [Streptomyces sp. NPDC048257]|uniref:hypothetical protein n=1 Tax=Streptomyces sp. NPDC048257 TaxID=3365526 RepID=UPI00371C1AF3